MKRSITQTGFTPLECPAARCSADSKADNKAKVLTGFTLIEILVTIAILGMIFTLTVTSLTSFGSSNRLTATLEELKATIDYAKVATLSGDTAQQSNRQQFGLYFTPNAYILFIGPSYQPDDSNNIITNLNGPLIFESITFPSQTLLFATVTGQVQNYSPGQNSVILRSTHDNRRLQLSLNRYGIVHVTQL